MNPTIWSEREHRYVDALVMPFSANMERLDTALVVPCIFCGMSDVLQGASATQIRLL